MKTDFAGPSAVQGRERGAVGRERAPWVLVAGGFHQSGGMDKANAALATYLLEHGRALHLVAHLVAPEFACDSRVSVHLVPRPAGSFLLGEQMLARRGRRVAAQVKAHYPDARVVVNGGNCAWPDINWVHAVHHEWPTCDDGAPAWFRAKNRFEKSLARRRERRAVLAARLVLANSERTRRALIDSLGVPAERVHTVYLGSDGDGSGAATTSERAAARAWLGVEEARPLVVFVGALGHDRNKGFDTLWRAWVALAARESWDARLVVAGGGRAVGEWRRCADAEGLSERVKFLGFTGSVREVLAAADLLVSPARYEAYGLNVHEAICRGVPALVSASAGIAERYPHALQEMLLPRADAAEDLSARLLRWRTDVEGWKQRFAAFAAELRSRAWADMAAEIVALVESHGEAAGDKVTERESSRAEGGREARAVPESPSEICVPASRAARVIETH